MSDIHGTREELVTLIVGHSRNVDRLREVLRIVRVMVHDEPIAYAQYSNGRTLIQILDLALAHGQDLSEK